MTDIRFNLPCVKCVLKEMKRVGALLRVTGVIVSHYSLIFSLRVYHVEHFTVGYYIVPLYLALFNMNYLACYI